MTEGPFGGPRPFARDKRTVLVLVGVDDTPPPNKVQVNMRESVNREVNQTLIDNGIDVSITRNTVGLVVEQNPTPEQINVLGEQTLHVQQYGIKTQFDKIGYDLAGELMETVGDELRALGFNPVGVKVEIT